MSSWNYIASSYKPTMVECANVGIFTSSGEQELIISKSNRLIVYEIAPEGLIPRMKFSIFGFILSFDKLQARRNRLIVFTAPFALSLLSYEGSSLSVTQSIDMRDSQQTPINSKPFVLIDPLCQVVLLHIYSKILKVIHLNDRWEFGSQFTAALNKENVSDMKFIDSLKIAVLTAESLDLFSINVEQSTVIHLSSLQINDFYLIVLMDNTRFALFGHEKLLVYSNTNSNSTEIVNMSFGKVKAGVSWGENSFLLGNELGDLILLKNMNEIVVLGKTSIVQSLVLLGNDLVFLTSLSGNPMLLKIGNDRMEVLEKLDNRGPIIDLSAEKDIVCCSGFSYDGSVRHLKKGVTLSIEVEVSVGNVLGIWSYKANSDYFSLLFISNRTDTIAMCMNECNLLPKQFPGIVKAPSIYVGTLPDGAVQVTPQLINVLDTDITSKYNLEVGSITHAVSFGSFLTVATAERDLIFFCLENGIQELRRKHFEVEIACLSMSESIIAVGLWGEISLLVLSQDLEILWTDSFTEGVVPRSIVIQEMEGIFYLFIGYADGQLVIFSMPDRSRKIISMGSRPIKLTAFTYLQSNYIFGACDNPFIVFSKYKNLNFADVNLDSIDMMAPFHTEDFPNCLAIIKESKLLMAGIEELSGYSTTIHSKQISVRKIISHTDYYICAAIDSSGVHKLLFLDKTDFTELNSVSLDQHDFIHCFSANSTLLYLGVSHSNNDNAGSESGKMLIYRLDEEIFQVGNIAFELPITVLACIKDTHLVGAMKSDIIFWKLNGFDIEYINKPCRINFAYAIDTMDDLIAIGDIKKALIIFQITENGLQTIFRSYHYLSPTAIKLVARNSLIVADCRGNILLFENTIATRLDYTKGLCVYEGVNRFRQGEDFKCEELMIESPTVLFGTTKGTVGVILKLPEYSFKVLNALQDAMARLRTAPVLNLQHFRTVHMEKATLDRFIDGDFVQEFIHLDDASQVLCISEINSVLRTEVTLQQAKKLIFALSKALN